MRQKASSSEHWDRIFSQDTAYSRIELPAENDPVLTTASDYFGDLAGKVLIDLGAGNGKASLYFARKGAHVLSVDQSQVAINNLTVFCMENEIANIEPLHRSAMEIGTLGPADFVFGSMILHHIEPFAKFAAALDATLTQNGTAFFWENNAFSKTMIWFRQHVVGRAWVPKFGDSEEFPLTPAEVEVLRSRFDVKVSYPELLYFRLVSQYVFRGHLQTPFALLDSLFYKLPWFRRYSYRQYLYLSRRA